MVDGLAFGWVCILVEDVEFFVEMKNLIRREEGGQNERMFNYFVHCKKCFGLLTGNSQFN